MPVPVGVQCLYEVLRLPLLTPLGVEDGVGDLALVGGPWRRERVGRALGRGLLLLLPADGLVDLLLLVDRSEKLLLVR